MPSHQSVLNRAWQLLQPKNGTRLPSALLLGTSGALLAFFSSSSASSNEGASDPANSTSEAAETEAQASHIYADGFLVWIYQNPRRDPAPIGMLRAGQSTALRSHEGRDKSQPVKRGCGRGWYAVEPAGFICLDHVASLSPTRYSESMAQLLPRQGAYPFEYALSMGSPSYRRVPTETEWQKRERIFGEAKVREMPPHWRGHEELAHADPLPLGSIPDFLGENGSVSRLPEKRLERRDVPFGSMLAVTGSFSSEGRTFLMSADGTVVPADRMSLFRPSKFQGVELSSERESGYSLPLGWPRKKTKVYSLAQEAECAVDGSGTPHQKPLQNQGTLGRLGRQAAQLKKSCLRESDSFVATRTPLPLTGRVVDIAGTRFAELREKGKSRWLPSRYLFVAEKEAVPGSATEKDGRPKKWIHFSISEGTLTSYLGEMPLFSTLASPGIGGTPARGADPLDTRTTPVGTYRITFKYKSDDMSPEQSEHRKFWIADVPHTMYFKQPFAIHVAYWHESFGEPMSGGCINVSPKDGARLFSFTDPPLPPSWYGVGSSKSFGYGTTVVIER